MVNTNEPVDPLGTIPPTEPTIPTIADLLPAKARSWIYALLAPVNAALIPLTINLDGSARTVVTSVIAGVNTLGFGVALSNVPRRVG